MQLADGLCMPIGARAFEAARMQQNRPHGAFSSSQVVKGVLACWVDLSRGQTRTSRGAGHDSGLARNASGPGPQPAGQDLLHLLHGHMCGCVWERFFVVNSSVTWSYWCVGGPGAGGFGPGPGWGRAPLVRIFCICCMGTCVAACGRGLSSSTRLSNVG